ncbi:hypothetical protein HanRHA438_Chr12g0534341 [Helianthus annuus]|nr:hypothetical protein HanRHA438_Chr12g0534341 [Helianthus annuus]
MDAQTQSEEEFRRYVNEKFVWYEFQINHIIITLHKIRTGFQSLENSLNGHNLSTEPTASSTSTPPLRASAKAPSSSPTPKTVPKPETIQPQQLSPPPAKLPGHKPCFLFAASFPHRRIQRVVSSPLKTCLHGSALFSKHNKQTNKFFFSRLFGQKSSRIFYYLKPIACNFLASLSCLNHFHKPMKLHTNKPMDAVNKWLDWRPPWQVGETAPNAAGRTEWRPPWCTANDPTSSLWTRIILSRRECYVPLSCFHMISFFISIVSY